MFFSISLPRKCCKLHEMQGNQEFLEWLRAPRELPDLSWLSSSQECVSSRLSEFICSLQGAEFAFCEHRPSWPSCILTSTLYSIAFPNHSGTFALCTAVVPEPSSEVTSQRAAAAGRNSGVCSGWDLIENTIQPSPEIQR